jgi:hypothetical protein
MILSRPQSEYEERVRLIERYFQRVKNDSELRERLWNKTSGVCIVCKVGLPYSDDPFLSIDHAIPIYIWAHSTLDTDVVAVLANDERGLHLVHADCNSAKRDRDLEELLEDISRGEIAWREPRFHTAQEIAAERRRLNEIGAKNGAKGHSAKDANGKSVLGVKNGARLHSVKDENGKSAVGVKNMARFHSVKDTNGKSIYALKGAAAVHSVKDANGKSVAAVKGAASLHSVKDENGKSVAGVKCGKAGAAVIHSAKDANGKSVLGVKSAARLHSVKDENGKSVAGVKAAARIHSVKDENGKSVSGVKSAARLHSVKDENGKSLVAVTNTHNRHHVRRNIRKPETCSLCAKEAL